MRSRTTPTVTRSQFPTSSLDVLKDSGIDTNFSVALRIHEHTQNDKKTDIVKLSLAPVKDTAEKNCCAPVPLTRRKHASTWHAMFCKQTGKRHAILPAVFGSAVTKLARCAPKNKSERRTGNTSRNSKEKHKICFFWRCRHYFTVLFRKADVYCSSSNMDSAD